MQALEQEVLIQIESTIASGEQNDDLERKCLEVEQYLYGLDLGVAAAVVSLAAAKCIPFSSCNAGTFGGYHQERYPLIAFHSRPQMVDLLITCAAEADIGIEGKEYLVAYANDIRKIRRFAESLIRRRSLFISIRTGGSPQQRSQIETRQYKLPLE